MPPPRSHPGVGMGLGAIIGLGVWDWPGDWMDLGCTGYMGTKKDRHQRSMDLGVSPGPVGLMMMTKKDRNTGDLGEMRMTKKDRQSQRLMWTTKKDREVTPWGTEMSGWRL